jgi:hypothetical protein
MKTMLAILAFLLSAQDDFSARFKAARPTDDQLRFYSFDWAKESIRNLGRPVRDRWSTPSRA